LSGGRRDAHGGERAAAVREAPVSRPAAAGGFTLIELLVVVAIVAMLAGVGLVGLGGIRRARLQDQAFAISRMSRNALIRALSRAATVRMVVDLDNFRLSLEEAGSAALVDETGKMVVPDGGEDAEEAYGGPGTGLEPGAGGEPLGTGTGAGEEGLAADEEGGGMGGLFGGLGGLGDLFGGSSALEELQRPPKYRPPVFTELDEPRLRPIELQGVKTMRVYLPGAEEPITEGRAYVLYHDDGTADEAVIHIEDDRGQVYAIAIRPLTGRGALYPYPFVPEPPEVLP
jgi:prepilin-type N-terminal cleavage/methylation domain-containing protein